MLTALYLYDYTSGGEEDRRQATLALVNACSNWSEDPNIMRGVITLFEKVHTSPKQVSVSPEEAKVVEEALLRLKRKNKDDKEMVAKINENLKLIGVAV